MMTYAQHRLPPGPDLVKIYEDGSPVTRMAKLFNVSESTMWLVLRANKARTGRRSQCRVDQIRAMRADGLSQQKIGDHFGVTQQAVQSLCKRYE